MPQLRPLPRAGGPLPLDRADHVLVVGGGKGITAECALALARATGCAVSALGRASPMADAELAANLARLAAFEGRYLQADVGDPAAVYGAVREAERLVGRAVTALIYGGGVNRPVALDRLEQADIEAVLRPKTDGLLNVLQALDPDVLRLLVTFGSLIGRLGFAGEAHYGLANEQLVARTQAWGERHPRTSVLSIEWSAWSGVGMARRLGSLETLRRAGVVPIPPEVGVELFQQILAGRADGSYPQTVIATGRFGAPPTAPRPGRLPLWRFLEHPRVHLPGVELVCDARLSAASDPYLEDHRFEGTAVMPAVMALEAAAQVAMALLGVAAPPAFADLQLLRPITVGHERSIRIAALATGDRQVRIAVRSEETAYQADHVTLTCDFDRGSATCRSGPRRPHLSPG